jgi:hypothetical protein
VNLLTITLGTLVDRALAEARNMYEVGRPVVRAESLSTSDNTFTLNVDANIGNILEFGSELILVTDKSADATPVYTGQRGYFGTTAAARSAAEAGILDPTYTRRQTALGVQRAFPAMEAGRVRPRHTAAFTAIDDPTATVDGRVVVELPTAATDVLGVRYGLDKIPGWQLLTDVDTDVFTDGRVLLLPYGWDTSWGVTVTYEAPYRWSTYPDDPVEASTVQVPEQAQFVPSTYATAYLLSGREYSRTELDRAEEFSRSEPVRGGASRATVRDAWAAFYRALDEARRTDNHIPERPYVEMQY